MPTKKRDIGKETLQKILKEKRYDLDNSMILAARLDNAYFIFMKCRALLKFNIFNPKIQRKLANLQQDALSFLKNILNVDNVEDILGLMKEREIKKNLNPEFIPGKIINPLTQLPRPEDAKSPAQYNFRKLAELGLAHERGKILVVDEETRNEDSADEIKMFTPEERDTKRVLIHNKIFVERNPEDNEFLTVDTATMKSHGKKGFASFTINTNGELSVFEHFGKIDKVAHSTMNASAPVIGAGELKITNGKLDILTDYSGHYKPELMNVIETLKFFVNQQIDISEAKVILQEKLDDALKIKLIVSPAGKFCYTAMDILNISQDKLLQIKETKKEMRSSDMKNVSSASGASASGLFSETKKSSDKSRDSSDDPTLLIDMDEPIDNLNGRSKKFSS